MTLSIKSSLFSGKTLRDNLYFLINVQLSAQCNLDLLTLNLVATWYIVVIFALWQWDFINDYYKVNTFGLIMGKTMNTIME